MTNTMEQKNMAAAMVFERRPRETTKTYAAFKTYLDMGPTRSLRAVAAKLGLSRQSIERVSRRHAWSDRVDAYNRHFSDLERQAIERLACEKAVEWWQLHEPARRQAWLEAEEAIAMVREARERWRKSGRTPGFEGMARMLDLAFKLKQFAAGMPSEIKEVHNLHAGKVSLEWEEAIRKAYQVAAPPATVVEGREPRAEGQLVEVEEVKP